MQGELYYDTNEFTREEESEADEKYGGANATRDKHRLSEQHDARRTDVRYERVHEIGESEARRRVRRSERYKIEASTVGAARSKKN